jgi:sucrose-6-phosphate hydrolase SacC (GH32 family)
MKWKKLGKIFDPTQHQLPNNCKQFAQSPQVLVCDDVIRIYFTTREVEPSGKYLGHIAFVDFDKELKNIIQISKNTVIPLGGLGSFDEHGIFPMNVLKYKNKIFGYTSGLSRRKSVSLETSIGLAFSNNEGLTFEKYGKGPIVSSSLHEPFLVCDAFVSVYEDVFHMWYIYGLKWIDNAEDDGTESRVYKIAHATSSDGIHWTKNSKLIIPNSIGEDECQALPTVVKIGSRYHMYFCYRYATGFRKIKGRGYKLGYAYSDDLINWTRDDKNAGIGLSEDGWDSEMMCYPHLFESNGNVYLLYNGNEFGRTGFGLAVLDQG